MESMVTERLLKLQEVTPALFDSFERYQEVKRCWRKEDGRWVLKDIAFIEQWDAQDYQKLCKALKEIIQQGGAVWGAFASRLWWDLLLSDVSDLDPRSNMCSWQN